MGVERFEDLVAWQCARRMTKSVYDSTRSREFRRDFGLSSQIQRASVSVMSNIAEGFERNRPKEFHQALSTSKASCAEVRSLLYVALDAGYIDESRFRAMMDEAVESSKVVGGLRASVERRLNSEDVKKKQLRKSRTTQKAPQ